MLTSPLLRINTAEALRILAGLMPFMEMVSENWQPFMEMV